MAQGRSLWRVIWSLLIELAAIAPLWSSPVRAADPIVIAVAGPMTGALSPVGQQYQIGATAAIDALEGHQLLGRPVVLSVQDDVCDPTVAVSVARKLVLDKPALVIGHNCSDTTLAVEGLYADNGIVEISASSTSPAVTEQGIKTLFRMVGRDDNQAKMAAARIARDWPKGRIALLDDGRTYGAGMTTIASTELTRLGLTPVLHEQFESEAVSYGPLVQRLKAAAADVVYFGGYSNDAALLVRQMREAGLTATLIGGDSMISQDFWVGAGAAGEGALFTFSPDVSTLPSAANAIARLKEKGMDGSGYTLLVYAAFEVWAEGVRRAGTTEAKAVADAIRAAPIPTIIGPVSFDGKGDIRGPNTGFVWYRWHQGQPVRQE